jgi:hypothetical protein
MRIALTAALALPLSLSAHADADAWKDLAPLLGRWEALDGDGAPGKASSGAFSFERDLDGKVLVRKNRAEYPARGGRPAFVHQDLMVISREGGAPRARYWDNEGHYIEYAIAVSADGKRWTFESQGAPAFRLEYEAAKADELSIRFSISPTGKADAFKQYLSATVRRAQ